jgi:glycosyltransferase involved in cell wall biosynthesis
MRIDLVFPAFPPALDGIGDYTAHLASTLGLHHDVRVLTAELAPVPCPPARVDTAFSTRSIGDIRRLEEAVALDLPDWLIVQYNPFSYGHWGFNPHLAATLRTLRRGHPSLRLAAVVHEPFVPVETWKFAVMWTWQHWQFRRLGRTVDALFFPLQTWADRFGPWFPEAAVHVLPVGSNIPNVGADRAETRRALGIEDRLVVGLFGTAHPSRQLGTVRTALDRLRADGQAPLLLYVGPHGPRVQAALGGHALYDAGPLPAEAVSRHVAAMDVYLAPFEKGVSARRGSFLVGPQHGIATVSTRGVETDPLFGSEEETGVLLAPDDAPAAFADHVGRLVRDPALRARRAAAGAAFYDRTFSWPRLATQLTQALTPESAPAPPSLSIS